MTGRNHRVVVFLVFFGLVTGWTTAWGAAGTDLMAEGEKFFKQRMDLNQAKKSADRFRKAMKLRPADPEPAWKLARSLCWIAEKTKDNKKRRLAVSAEALKAAKKALELAPDQAAPHFFVGLSYVYYGEARGMMEMVDKFDEVKAEFEKVIELDPGFLGGAAYTILARGYYYLPEFMGGGRDRALAYYKKALHYGPRQFATHVYLAEHYIKTGQLAKARALVQQVLDGPPMEGQEPEWEEWKPEAEYYMRKIEEKEAAQKKRKG